MLILNHLRELKDNLNWKIGLTVFQNAELNQLKIYTKKSMLKLEKILIIKREPKKLLQKDNTRNSLSQDWTVNKEKRMLERELRLDKNNLPSSLKRNDFHI